MSKSKDHKLVTANAHGQLGAGHEVAGIAIAAPTDVVPVKIVEDGILYSDGSVISNKSAAKPSHEILMSRTNPNGFPLEELLAKLVVEIEGKTNHIRSNKNLAHVVNNNNRVIAKLQEAIDIWNESREGLTKTFGEDKGPTNPRV